MSSPNPRDNSAKNWSAKSVILTGGAGFLGTAVSRVLHERGCTNIFVPRRADFDLREMSAIERLLDVAGPTDLVIHLAASVGGIGYNQAHPAELFYDNAIMGIQLMEAARRHGVGKFVALGTICAYPKYTPVPFEEDSLWSGYPEETNAPYGLAKKMMLVQAQAYRQQYGFNAIYLLPVNLYGPGDNFDPESSHVVPALIKKCLDAQRMGLEVIEVWGDGSPTREFLYIDDAAEGVVLAAEHYDGPEPVNLGSAFEISIRNLVDTIIRQTGYSGTVVWDKTRPNGQPRRKLDVSRAQKYFGFHSKVGFEEGLRRTVEWYRSSLDLASP